MITYETFCQIKDLHQRQGLNAPQIAAALELHRHTVAKWLAESHYRPRRSAPRRSKLDLYKADIVRWLDSHPLSAAQIFQRLRE
jgi:transposase